jgi:AcrR family transcriptional regulator
MTTETPATYGTQRKAAAQNRTAIIDAARELFQENPLVPLNDVAKRAGVGAGTLYRHFPTREDLILAAYQRDIDQLSGTVDEVLARNASAAQAFIEWFDTLAANIKIKHGLGDALHSAAAQSVIASSWGPTSEAVGRLVEACVAEGTIAAGHDPSDIIMLMSFLWRVAPNASGEAQAQRLITTVFNGLKATPQKQLPATRSPVAQPPP